MTKICNEEEEKEEENDKREEKDEDDDKEEDNFKDRIKKEHSEANDLTFFNTLACTYKFANYAEQQSKKCFINVRPKKKWSLFRGFFLSPPLAK